MSLLPKPSSATPAPWPAYLTPHFPRRLEHERYRFTRANLFFVGKQLDAKSVADLSQILHPGEAVEFIATNRRAPKSRSYDADRVFVYPNRTEPDNVFT